MTALTILLLVLLAWTLSPLAAIPILLGTTEAHRTLLSSQNRLKTGLTFSEKSETEHYTLTRTVENGIERIVYTPRQRRHQTPILMAHGMWHGAWCWKPWQEYFAEQGWESIAYSLPGHGKSPFQRPLWRCTLDYYLAFLRDEVDRLPRKPVLIGHSMGGALAQWYLTYVGDDLPAIILLAPWAAPDALKESFPLFLRLDPLGIALSWFVWNAGPFVRSPKQAARKLISPRAPISPQELQARLGSESAVILFQHRPPFWTPPASIQTPVLALAGEQDTMISVNGLRLTASTFGADFMVVPEAGHNIMMDINSLQTAESIQNWLEEHAAEY